MRAILPIALAIGLAGCSADNALNQVPDNEDRDTASIDDTDPSDGLLDQIRLDVRPPSDLVSSSRRAYLPQTVVVTNPETATRPLQITLAEPIVIQGRLSAYDVAPYGLTDLPGEVVDVADALVTLELPGTAQGRIARTTDFDDAAPGRYQITIVPGTGYLGSFVPSDAHLPFRSVELDLNDDATLDIDLGAGLPIFGVVTDPAGDPVAGARVHAVNSASVAGPDAITGADGAYELRVDPGVFSVVCTGPTGREPQLERTDLLVAESGLEVDLEYADLTLVPVFGRIVDPQLRGVDDAVVTFRADALEAYGPEASLTVSVQVDESGNFDTRLLAGAWTVDVSPGVSVAAGGVRDSLTVASAQVDLGQIDLPELTELQASVLDSAREPVVNASVIATEVGFGGRSYTGTSDAFGRVSLTVPPTALQVTLTPPPDRAAAMALTQVVLDPLLDVAPDLTFAEGAHIEGTVVSRNSGGGTDPVQFATITAVGPNGTVIGVTVTDADGNFAFEVQRGL